jgi:hypothetical protein
MNPTVQSNTTAQPTTYRYTDDMNKLIVSAPVDRIRWASVLGGLFAVLSAIIFFTVTGIAVGFSTFDAYNPESFGIGAGVYGALSFIAAFALGGFLAARTASVAGPGNGILNGAMVWVVALPIIVNVLGTGVGALLGVATSAVGTVADTAVQLAAPVVAENADEMAAAAMTAAPTLESAAQTVAEGTAESTEIAAPVDAAVATAQGVVSDVQEQVENIDPADINEVARDLSAPAWAALLALGLSALAAIGGGWLGARTTPTDVAIIDRTPRS